MIDNTTVRSLDGTPIEVVRPAPRSSTRGRDIPEEQPGELTQPLPTMTAARLFSAALRMRLNDVFRGRMGAAVIAGALLAAAATVVLRDGASEPVPPPVTTPPTVSSTTTAQNPQRELAHLKPITATEDPAAFAPQQISAETLAALPAAEVGSLLAEAPSDPAPAADPGFTAAHPTEPVPVYHHPGGGAFAHLPVRQVLTPTWVPVVARQPGWVRVLLPTPPAGDGVAPMGWLYLDRRIDMVEHNRRVEIDLSTGTVTVLSNLGRVATTTVRTVPSSGRARSFVAIPAGLTGAPWVFKVLWPLAGSADRICTNGWLGAATIPGLPAESPLGVLHQGIPCLTTPKALHDALAEVPAGTPVVMR